MESYMKMKLVREVYLWTNYCLYCVDIHFQGLTNIENISFSIMVN